MAKVKNKLRRRSKPKKNHQEEIMIAHQRISKMYQKAHQEFLEIIHFTIRNIEANDPSFTHPNKTPIDDEKVYGQIEEYTQKVQDLLSQVLHIVNTRYDAEHFQYPFLQMCTDMYHITEEDTTMTSWEWQSSLKMIELTINEEIGNLQNALDHILFNATGINPERLRCNSDKNSIQFPQLYL